MTLLKRITYIMFCFLCVSCLPVETNDAEKAYKYWSSSEIPKEIEVIEGAYYQSPHFTLEYEFFLKFKSDEKWFEAFVKQNQLQIDTVRNDWSMWTELPAWFQPDPYAKIYAKDPNDAFDRSRYFRDSKTGISYIYETVGM